MTASYEQYVSIDGIADENLRNRVACVLEQFMATPEGARYVQDAYDKAGMLRISSGANNEYDPASHTVHINEAALNKGGLGNAMYYGTDGKLHHMSLNRLLAHEIFGHAANKEQTQHTMPTRNELYKKTLELAYADKGLPLSEDARSYLGDLEQLHTQRIMTDHMRHRMTTTFETMLEQLNMSSHREFAPYDRLAYQQLVGTFENAAMDAANPYLAKYYGEVPRDKARYFDGVASIDANHQHFETRNFKQDQTPQGYVGCPTIREAALGVRESLTSSITVTSEGAAQLGVKRPSEQHEIV